MISRLIFLIYLFCVFWITLIDRIPTHRRKMIVPFWEYSKLFFSGNQVYWMGQIGGNILMLVPLGFFLPFLFKEFRSFKRTVSAGFLLSVFIEVTQFVTARGLCEFDDVFNNTLGTYIGYIIYKIVYKFRS